MKSTTRYKLKSINEDFQVTEVPLMPRLCATQPCSYTYIWIQKSGFTTFDVLDQLKKFFHLNFSDINNQGLKDEDAITEQLLSVKKLLNNKDIAAFNKKYRFKNKFSHIKYIVGYGTDPVKERMLHGNSFRIVIRNLKNHTAENLQKYISAQRYHHFINYYDDQRFGMPGGPHTTHLIGKAIVYGDWERAYKLVKNSNNLQDQKSQRKSVNTKGAFMSINPKKISFFVSSYNSFLWNAHASSVVKKHTKSTSRAFKHIGQLHIPTEHSFQCPHICEAPGFEFMADDFSIKPKANTRNLIVTTTTYAHNLEKDELNKNMRKLTLSFFLPTGSYATMIIKQIFLRLDNQK